MSKLPTLIFALLFTAGAIGQEGEGGLYGRLSSMSSSVVSEFLESSICSPSPALERKQAELAKAISIAAPDTGPLVLEMAVMANSYSEVKRLLEGGALHLSSAGSLLHTAAMFGDPSILEVLASYGFNMEDSGNAGGPALLAAVHAGRIENAKWLVENGANVNAMDTSGASVIRHSVYCGHQGLVDLLLEAGAVPDSKAQQEARRLGISL